MYLDHFGLSEALFCIAPHTGFYFSGARRGATLDALLYASIDDQGNVRVIGEAGSGKTMTCLMVMERLPADVAAIHLADPSLAREDILRAIAGGLAIGSEEIGAGAIQERLIKLAHEGQRVLVLIDEAHAMPVETLEAVLHLSKIEANGHNPLRFILFGQAELNDVLARPEMRRFRQDFTHSFALEPLAINDSRPLSRIPHACRRYLGPDIFSAAAVKLLAEASLGLAGRINILADKALLAAFSQNTRRATRRHVSTAIRESGCGPPSRARSWHRTAGYSAAAAVLVPALLAFWPKSSQQSATPPMSMPGQPASPPPQPAQAMIALPAEAGQSAKLGVEIRTFHPK